MADTKISVTSQKPGVAGYDQFDVFNGKDGLSREEYKGATFQTSGDMEGDASFKHKAELLEATGSELMSEEEAGETESEKKEEKEIED